MKTLYLLRHARSSKSDASLADRDRPLDARGEQEAATMAERWSLRWSDPRDKPDLIVSSPAARALATARAVAPGLRYPVADIRLDEQIYDATVGTLISVIESLDNRLDRVMLVGHDPAFTALARHFDGGIIRMPTCALAEFSFDAETWSGIARTRPARTAFDSPTPGTG